MPVLHFNDQQFPLAAGTTRVGAGSGVDVPIADDPAMGVLALIEEAAAGRRTVRRAGASAQVRVNDVLLGAEATPLMHGDRLEIGGVQLRYAEDAKAGVTQFVGAGGLAELTGAKRSGAAQPTAASGGRLVSLVDGKEYTVADEGIAIGRDASCDVVIGQSEVSRRHAEIVPGEQGYVVRDMSANGVFVNGHRVQGSQRLARADVLRVGSEEFRFYADVLAPSPASPAASVPAPAAPPMPEELVEFELEPPPPLPAPAPPRPAPAAVSPAAPAPPTPPTPSAAPPSAPSPASAFASLPTPLASPAHEDPRPPLATLESLNVGPAKGTRHPLRTPLAHVGRGAHNDVRLVDDSVSETHAKLQKREDGWYVVDLGSTNGTYVGGTRIDGERRLEGSPDVRFGGVKMRFAEVDAAPLPAGAKGTRPIASVERVRPSVAPPPAVRDDVPPGGISGWVWLVALLVVAAAAFFLLQGGA